MGEGNLVTIGVGAIDIVEADCNLGNDLETSIARLKDLGYPPTRFREDLRSRMPEPEETERLQLPPGTPVVEITRTAYTSEDRPVEINEMIADASAYIFRYDFDA